MNEIHVLDSGTVDQIAAGEVVERPASVVKELVENAIDAGASHITVEIKEGGISFIRVTDDGCGIAADQLEKAFLRHATSKITSAQDLAHVASLGFRGEALSSIAAVCQVELITKTEEALTGQRFVINGGQAQELSEVGAPKGTTMLVRNIFYNTPVRRKFLKTPATEGGYISDFMQHMAMSAPDIAFQFIMNGQTKFYTSGNGELSEVIYRIYGRETASELVPIEAHAEGAHITGFLGKPVLGRANRSYETFFVNRRYIKSSLISTAVEEGYKTFLMQHKYPFVVLHFEIDPEAIDVNVHPTKMEIRINDPMRFLSFVREAVREGITSVPLIVSDEAGETGKTKEERKAETQRQKELTGSLPQPFEEKRRQAQEMMVREESGYQSQSRVLGNPPSMLRKLLSEDTGMKIPETGNVLKPKDVVFVEKAQQLSLFTDEQILEQEKQQFQILGQVFDTYWILALPDKIYYVDQHAAHEKVMYERLMKQYREKQIAVQSLNPPIIVTLSLREQDVLLSRMEQFTSLGFEIDEFGERSYAIRSVPTDLYGLTEKELFLTILDELAAFPVKGDCDAILSKIASMACKAAVKGNQKLSTKEAQELMKELLACDNPFNCPHGRPTMISMTKYEMERKFKR